MAKKDHTKRYFAWITMGKRSHKDPTIVPQRCYHQHKTEKAAVACGKKPQGHGWDEVTCEGGFTPPGVAVVTTNPKIMPDGSPNWFYLTNVARPVPGVCPHCNGTGRVQE